jgi:hypothetical protein
VFAFPAAVEESDENLGQLLMVLGSQDEAILGAIETLAAAQGASGEATEDEKKDMVCADCHFVPPVGGLLLHLDKDLVEQGRR